MSLQKNIVILPTKGGKAAQVAEKQCRERKDGKKEQRKARQICANLDRFVRAICSDNVTNVQFKKDGNFQSTCARSPKKARRNLLREHPRHA